MTKPQDNISTAVAPKTTGNPDGKGASAFALDWQQSAPRGVVAKPRTQLMAEFFTSMLILSSSFKFRPVMGELYYLYWINGEWSLSLIAPDEWSEERRSAFAGTCQLQRDITWTIDPSDLLKERNPVSEAMGRFYEAFSGTLDTDRVLEDVLPFFIKEMPYYQRLYASGLSRSILASMKLGEQTETSSNDWQALLPGKGVLLIEHRSEP
ncbi:MAG: DUF2452 domain-containing protein [Gammaproteobacteria bacterium]